MKSAKPKKKTAKPKKKMSRSFGELSEKCRGCKNDCDCKDCKEVVFFEQSRTDDQKQKDALGALHARLSLEERERAYKWTTFYKALVDGSETE